MIFPNSISDKNFFIINKKKSYRNPFKIDTKINVNKFSLNEILRFFKNIVFLEKILYKLIIFYKSLSRFFNLKIRAFFSSCIVKIIKL